MARSTSKHKQFGTGTNVGTRKEIEVKILVFNIINVLLIIVSIPLHIFSWVIFVLKLANNLMYEAIDFIEHRATYKVRNELYKDYSNLKKMIDFRSIPFQYNDWR